MKVVVVGGGVIGLASAYHLLKQGEEVTLVESATVGSGASHGNAGWIVPSESGPVAAPGMVLQGLRWMLKRDSPLYIKPSVNPGFLRFMLAMARRCNRTDFRAGLRANIELGEHTMELFDSYLADGVRFEMHSHGLIMAFAQRATFEQHTVDLDIPAALGLEPEILRGPEVAEREPALSPSLAGGIYFPHERHVRPDSLVRSLATRCRELGAEFLEHDPLIDVRRSGGRITSVTLPDRQLEADAFLLAAGAQSGPLSTKFGTPLPVRPGKGYSVDYTPAPVQLKSIVNLSDAKVAVTPLDGALRLAGTMEFAGWDTSVNPVRVAAIRRAPLRFFQNWADPEPSGPAWAGARPMTPDGLPIIGRLPGLANGYVATGHGMFGVTLGPATGYLIAEAISTGSTPPALRPFDPRRFRHGRSTT